MTNLRQRLDELSKLIERRCDHLDPAHRRRLRTLLLLEFARNDLDRARNAAGGWERDFVAIDGDDSFPDPDDEERKCLGRILVSAEKERLTERRDVAVPVLLLAVVALATGAIVWRLRGTEPAELSATIFTRDARLTGSSDLHPRPAFEDAIRRIVTTHAELRAAPCPSAAGGPSCAVAASGGPVDFFELSALAPGKAMPLNEILVPYRSTENTSCPAMMRVHSSMVNELSIEVPASASACTARGTIRWKSPSRVQWSGGDVAMKEAFLRTHASAPESTASMSQLDITFGKVSGEVAFTTTSGFDEAVWTDVPLTELTAVLDANSTIAGGGKLECNPAPGLNATLSGGNMRAHSIVFDAASGTLRLAVRGVRNAQVGGVQCLRSYDAISPLLPILSLVCTIAMFIWGRRR